MKILILSQTFPLTPADSTAAFMYDFARGFAQIGETVTVLVPFHPSLKPKLFQGVKVIPFKYVWPDALHLLGFGRTLENDQNLHWFVYLLAPLYYLFGVIAVFKAVHREKPDIISAHWILPNGFIGALVSLFTSAPLFITLAGSDVFISSQNIIFRTMAWFAKKKARRIISNSPRLLADLGTDGQIISYGVPPNPGQRQKGGRITVATAGRPVEKKGITLLQKIIPDIEIISGLPIQEFRQKLLDVDTFIALSIRDSKGNLDDSSLTVLEAMSAGCAVVVSDLPGYRRIIQHGKNGLLVNPSDPEAVKRAVQKLRNSKILRQRLGQAARRTIARSFTPEKIASQYQRLFQN